MFSNYLAAALRNMIRNKLYATINIIALAAGFAAVLLIALFVRDEFSYDKWIPEYQNVYRVQDVWHSSADVSGPSDWSGAQLAPLLNTAIPELGTFTRLFPEEILIRHGEIKGAENVAWADSNLFSVFLFPSIGGEVREALREPNSVVLTRQAALKYFGAPDAVGKTLLFNDTSAMRVTGVIEDLPSNTHLRIGVIASGVTAGSPLDRSRGLVLHYTRLKPGTSPHQVEKYVHDRVMSSLAPNTTRDYLDIHLQPLASLHFLPQIYQGLSQIQPSGLLKTSSDPALWKALTVVGGLILLTAVSSFVSLMTARAGKRAVEVGVRKVSGALRLDLIVQFVGEAILYVAAALALAAAFVHLMRPAYGTFLGRDLASSLASPLMLLAAATLMVLLALLSALYPAFVLSALRPMRVLKGSFSEAHRNPLHSALVVSQFGVLIALTLATLVIDRQTIFAMGKGFQFNTDQMLFITAPCTDSLKAEIGRVPGVKAAACTSGSALGKNPRADSNTLADGTVVLWEQFEVGVGFLELYGLRPVAGRFFEENRGDESERPSKPGELMKASVILNETAVRRFGFPNAEAALGQQVPAAHTPGPRSFQIVGVAPDFPVRSLRAPIEPTIFLLPGSRSSGAPALSHMAVKLDAQDLAASLDGIDKALGKVSPGMPVHRQFFDQHIEYLYMDLMRETKAFRIFSVVAVLIACLGLFGLAASTAEHRTKEIGIRKAMGARTTDILALLIWQFAKPVLWANIFAWPVAYFALRRWLESFAFSVELAPWMFLAASALALVIAVATVSGHALLVARTQPVSALRYE